MKTLKVCLYKDLPSIENRDENYIYFVYDKLNLYFGKSKYNEPFVITKNIPINPSYNLVYILFDGTVNVYFDHIYRQIGVIENKEECKILENINYLFYLPNNGSYTDITAKSLVTPFNNGSYQIVISLPEDTYIDKDSLIAYNEETNMFEVIGKKSEDINFNNKLYGVDTQSISTAISDMRINADIRISKAYDNILKILHDGIYADTKDKVTMEEYEDLVNSFNEYKDNTVDKFNEMQKEIKELTIILDDEVIKQKIMNVLQEQYDDIDNALKLFEESVYKLDNIETNVKSYADTKYNETYDTLNQTIVEAIKDPWDEF